MLPSPWLLLGLFLFYTASLGIVGYKAYHYAEVQCDAANLRAELAREKAKRKSAEDILAEWNQNEQREDAEGAAIETKLNETRRKLDELLKNGGAACIWGDADERRMHDGN